MTVATTLDSLARPQIVPVIVLDDPNQAEPLADALVGGGITTAEITLRTAAGLGAIARLAERTDILIGAGTVLNGTEAQRAIDSGARFLVSPGLDIDVLAAARDHDILALPGIATATELQRAAALGLSEVKLFPAELFGGVAMISALNGPFPQCASCRAGASGPTKPRATLTTRPSSPSEEAG
jgi:2-dehydro-3-deoxyphosphogluconate aldolase/(4S)-4-hydroxy-2-oxoglutarate aldolase